MQFSNSLTSRVLVAIVFALLLAQIVMLVNLYKDNYATSDGYSLANGNLVGGDFVTFFQAGQLIKQEPERLYDFEYYISKQQEFYHQHNLQGGVLVFAYPPLLGYMFSLLPASNLLNAYLAWTTVSLLLFFTCLTLIMKSVGASNKAVLLTSFAGLAFYCFSLSCIGAGQTSCLGLAVFTGFFLTFQKGRKFLAGLILALSYYKPPLFVGLVLALIASRNWRTLAGFMLGGISLLIASVAAFGYDNFLYFLKSVSNYRYGEPLVAGSSLPIEKGVGLLAALEGLHLFSSIQAQLLLAIVTILSSFFVGHTYLRLFKFQSNSPIEREKFLFLYTLLVALSLICSVQMVVYDLTILFPFAAASAYLVLRNKEINGPAGCYLLAAFTMYYEYNFRALPVGDLIIKGTTFVWLILMTALFCIFLKAHKPIHQN